jgi:hypothetical protein
MVLNYEHSIDVPPVEPQNSLATWLLEIKSKDIWDLSYVEELWEDQDDKSARSSDEDDHSYIESCEPAETHIVLCSKDKPLQKGAEVFLSYGRRSNSNLLIDYGFCYPNNPYEYAELVCDDGECYYLKAERLNLEILTKLRAEGHEVVQSLEDELATVQKYFEVCLMLLKNLEQFTNTEEDMQLLN